MQCKRWLGVLLCILLALEMVPVTVFAADGDEPVPTTIDVSTEEEFRNAVTTANTTAGNYIINLTEDITLTGNNNVELKNENTNVTVTILGNGHSIISNFTGLASILVNKNVTLNLGQPDGSNNLTIKGGSQSGYQCAMIRIGSNAVVNMYDNVSLRDYTNTAINNTNGGGAVYVAFAEFNMYGGDISNCSISSTGYLNHGAGVLVRLGATFNMYGGIISGNVQDSYGYGGGVAVVGATFNMYGGEIFDNTAPEYSSSYAQTYGSGGGSGGGVVISDNAQFNMTDGKIYGNTAAYAGGGVYATGDSTVNISGKVGSEIEIHDNTAVYGGGMYMYGSTATMENVKVYENKAITNTYSANCGGVYVRCPLDMTNVDIYENTCDYDCGGVYVYTDAILNMRNVKIRDNTAASYGGGVLLRARAEFNTLDDNVEVYGNTAELGGGVFSYGDFTLDKAKIYENKASLGGGGVCVAKNFKMTGGEIYENTADGGGGGVYINAGGAFNMTGGKVYKNNAEAGGGVITAGTSQFNMISGEIYKNEAKLIGGGVYANSSLTKTGGVIHNNTAENAGDDIAAESSDNLTLDSVGKDLILETTGETITGWYYDGSRFTGELDANNEPVYDETRWAVKDDDGKPYLYTYQKPDTDVTVFLKAAYCEHTLSDLVTDKEATCTEDGIGYKECEICGEKVEETIKATGHKEIESIDVKAACTTEGSKHTQCEICKQILSIETIPVKGHSYGEDITIAATCEAAGYIYHVCVNCGFIEKVKDLDKTGHKESDWISDLAANCIASGSQHKVCTVCGKLLDTESIDKTAHTFGEEIKTFAATCETAGYTYRECTVCGFIEKVAEIPAKTHTPSDWIEDVKAKDCVTPGSQHKECTACGKFLEAEVIKAPGHTYGATQTQAATCETAGYTYHECTVCKFTEKVDDIDATGHTYGAIQTQAAACETAGYTYHVCTKCDFSEKIADIKATGHKESAWITDAQADCVTAGSRHKKCTVCGKILDTEVIKATGHDFGELQTYDAACETAGYTYHECTVCKFTEKVDDIDATGHTVSGWIDDASADCVTKGSRHKECTVCGKLLETEGIAAEGHKFGETKTFAAACETAGYTYHECTVCGVSEKLADIKATGHTASDWIIDAEADCVTAGSRHQECEICGKLLATEVIAATGHTAWKPEKVDKAATCTENGIVHKECAACGHVEISEIKAAGHAWDEEVTVDVVPTCTTDGSQSIHCQNCDEVKDVEVIHATGHTPSEEWESDEHERWKVCIVCGEKLNSTSHTFGDLIVDITPTCTKAGRGHRICSGCGYVEREAIKAIGHAWDAEVTVDKEPTCTTDGSQSIHCQNCDEVKDSVVIPAPGHIPSETWETDDHERWRVCIVCGAVVEEIPHTFGELIVDKAPSCTETGNGHRICSGCGYEEHETIDVTGHSWDEEFTVDVKPTCTTDGSQSIHCQNCDAVKDVEVIHATGHTPSEEWESDEHERWKVCTVCGEKLNSTSHTFGDLIVDITPTCAKAGRGHRICSGCGYVEYEAIKAIGHAWDAKYTVDKEPTCTADGSKSLHCQNCNEVKDVEVIPAKGHIPSETWQTDDHERWRVCTVCGAVVEEIPHTFGELIVDKAASCTEAGNGHRICEGCGYEEHETIDATGHSWDEEVTVDVVPTCTTDGSQSIHCQNCGEVKDVEVIHATGHTPSEEWESDEHERWKVCVVCGEKINSTSHTFGDLIVDITPTCAKAGRGHRICSGCGYVEYEAIKAIGHAWNAEVTVDAEPTCTADGSQSIHCQNCGEVKDVEVIPAKGHIPSETWETDDHERWRVCIVCGAVVEEIPHTFGELIVDKAASCTEAGNGHRICAGCGYEEHETIDATGHAWDEEFTVDVKPTCTTDGSQSIHCQNCGEVKDSELIPAHGHTESGWSVDADAPCSTSGSQHKVCTVCEKLLATEPIPATGHTFGEIKTYDATCTTAGYTYHVCTVCGYSEKVEDIAATGHTWNPDQVDKAPTGTETGIGHRECAVCGHTAIFEIEAPDNTVVAYEYTVEGKYKFYLSHDEREFKAEDLIGHLFRTPVYKDGTKGESVEITDLSGIGFGGQTPKSVYSQSAPIFIGKIAATITDEFGTHDLKIEEMGTAYIAVKGDIDLNGEADAGDASYILYYAACAGSGIAIDLYSGDIEDEHIEAFVYFLGDVDGESEDHGKTTARGEADSQVDAADATSILSYAAQVGALGYQNVKWEDILYPNVPLYTALIAGRK